MNTVTNPIDISVKSSLAKLLAKENIQVQTGNYRTASFDPVARILFLPVFKAETMTKDMIDLFIGHEVSHALYTPMNSIEDVQAKYPQIPFSLFNIVEDIRIERLIQKTYPGLMINFRNGYKELVERNFFGLNGKNIDSLSLPDRINIHAKIGTIVPVAFTESERDFFNRCYGAETFEEVVKLTVELYERIKSGDFKEQEPETQKQMKPSESEEGDEESPDAQESMPVSAQDDSSDSDDDKTASKAETSNAEESEDKPGKPVASQDETKDEAKAETEVKSDKASATTGTSTSTSTADLKDFSVSTVNAAEEAFKNNTETLKVNIFTVPGRAELNAALITYKELAELRKQYYSSDLYLSYNTTNEDFDANFKKFSDDSKKYVSNLVNEFNRKKSASLYSRTTTAKVGILDTTRMHSYKFSEDIFKSVSVTPEDVNHGMVMFIDMSASMGSAIHDVAKQVIQLAMFCRQVGVKFEVYGFNTTSHMNEDKQRLRAKTNMLNWEKPTAFHIHYDCLNLLHLLSSDQSKTEFTDAIKAMFKYGSCADNFDLPHSERLSGTPSVEAMIAAHTLVNDFKKKNKVEKLNVIVLSDGDGSVPRLSLPKDYTTSQYYNKTTFLLNGRQINIDISNFNGWYTKIVENLGITTGANMIGYYLVPSNRKWIHNKFTKLNKEQISYIVDNGSSNIGKHTGFSSYFLVTSNSMSYDDDEEIKDFKVDSNNISSRANIKKMAAAFGKHMESYKNSRVFLREFSSVIA